MPSFVNICGGVLADTTYVNGKLCARDTAITLPEVVPMTTDINAMGTMTKPMWPLIENMESSFVKIGVDLGLRDALTPGVNNIEHRWVQPVTDANGNTRNVPCKAFLKGEINKLPGLGVTVGEASENENTFTITRYALFVDGREMWLVDRLAGICNIAGKDMTGGMNSML